MGELKIYGMKAAFDEIMATAVKRQHEPQRIIGDLLNAEINEKQARSIKYHSLSPSCRRRRTSTTSSSRALVRPGRVEPSVRPYPMRPAPPARRDIISSDYK
jgi:hypothetical protein